MTQTRNRKKLPQHYKVGIYGKPTATMILNDYRLDSFSLKSGSR